VSIGDIDPKIVSMLRERGFEVEEATVILRRAGDAIYWRGSVTDLVTDIAELLDDDQLAELAGEAALAWRNRARGNKRL
jgi:hypothetical protein